jgi:hypothetical protein
VPSLAAVISGLEFTQQRLSLIFVEKIRSRVSIFVVKALRKDEKV